MSKFKSILRFLGFAIEIFLIGFGTWCIFTMLILIIMVATLDHFIKPGDYHKILVEVKGKENGFEVKATEIIDNNEDEIIKRIQVEEKE